MACPNPLPYPIDVTPAPPTSMQWLALYDFLLSVRARQLMYQYEQSIDEETDEEETEEQWSSDDE